MFWCKKNLNRSRRFWDNLHKLVKWWRCSNFVFSPKPKRNNFFKFLFQQCICNYYQLLWANFHWKNPLGKQISNFWREIFRKKWKFDTIWKFGRHFETEWRILIVFVLYDFNWVGVSLCTVLKRNNAENIVFKAIKIQGPYGPPPLCTNGILKHLMHLSVNKSHLNW